MASNIFNPQISGVSANTFVQDTAEDTTVADTLTLAANTAVEVGRSVVTSDLVGGGSTSNEVEANLDADMADKGTEREQESARETINNLTKLVSARKQGMPTKQANNRAATILKDAINDNPFYADDLRAEYKKFFGGSGGTGAAVFAMTAAEKVKAEYVAEIQAMSLRGGFSLEVAQARTAELQEISIQKERLGLATANRANSGAAYAQYSSLIANEARLNMSTAILADFSKGGPFTPEQQQGWLQQLPALETKLQGDLAKSLQDADGNPKPGSVDGRAVEDGRKEINATIKTLEALIKDSDMKSIVADNQAIMKDNFDMTVMKNFGGLMALKSAVGPDMLKYILQKSKGNVAFTTIMENDPVLKKIIGSSINLEKDLAKFIGASSVAFFGDNVKDVTEKTPTQQEEEDGGVALIISDPASVKMVTGAIDNDPERAEDAIRSSLLKHPGALYSFTNKTYKSAITKNPEKWKPVVQAGVESVVRGTLAQFYIAEGGIPSDFDIVGFGGFAPVGTPKEDLPAPTRFRATGTGMTALLQSNINTIRALGEQHPMLWKGKYKSNLDYVRASFGLEIGVLQK